MITITKSEQSAKSNDRHNDWSFLPTAMSTLLGVGIGITIGSYFGWM